MREGLLEARRVLVVGAGTQPSPDDEPDAPVGNGRAIAVECAREGAEVICADRDEGSARATVAMIDGEGGKSRVVVGDVRSEDACAAIVAVAAHDGLDGLVCNVGIGRGRGLAGTSADDWDTTFAVNLRSHFLLARAAVPVLNPGAAIVFISSVAGLQPGSRLPAYDASKAGLLGLCRHVALEAARRRRSRQRRRAGVDRHAARAQRISRPPVARAHAGPARTPGHRVGGRVRRHVPAVARRELRDRPGPPRRRRSHPDLTLLA